MTVLLVVQHPEHNELYSKDLAATHQIGRDTREMMLDCVLDNMPAGNLEAQQLQYTCHPFCQVAGLHHVLC